jgi:hypothetical protein
LPRFIARAATRVISRRSRFSSRAQVLAHVHDAEIKIGEGPEPPRDGLVQ